jgi:hypothetical protein
VHAFIVLVLMLGGAVGVWYGLVEDIELAFLAGLIAWGTASIGVFRGNFNPPDDIPKDARLEVRTAALSAVVIGLLVFGAGAAWMGFVEDIKIGVLVALLAWGAATYLAFSGNAGIASADAAEDADGVSSRTAGTIGLAALVVAGMALGAVGVWYGLVEDVKIGLAGGMLVWAGATLVTFRGKIALS